MIQKKLLSLFVVLMMVVAAAITVNKSLFRHEIHPSAPESKENLLEMADADIVSAEPDGTIIIHTKNIPGTVTGYAGAVPLDIYLKDDVITDIRPLPNVETPSFFGRASKVFGSWIGKNVHEAEALKVDGISGATYSSAAIISNVNAGLDYYLGLKNHRTSSVPLKIWIALAVTLIACIVPLVVKSKAYRTVQLIANVVVLGFWSGQFLDYSLILKYTSSGFTWPVGFIAVAMLIAAFVYPLFGHPQHYCTYICPLGSAQELVGKVCGYKIKITPKTLLALDWFRKILWAVLMLLLWADSFTSWMDFELFQAFMYKSAAWGIIVAACLFVALSAIVSRPYCRFVCPTGSLFKRAENIG